MIDIVICAVVSFAMFGLFIFGFAVYAYVKQRIEHRRLMRDIGNLDHRLVLRSLDSGYRRR